MDTSKDVCTYYKLRRKEDNYGNIVFEKILKGLMRTASPLLRRRHYFKPMLANMGQCRGHIVVDHTPKCHTELAGEGIEYSWVFANNYYRLLSLDKNKGKKNSKMCSRGNIKRQYYHKAGSHVL